MSLYILDARFGDAPQHLAIEVNTNVEPPSLSGLYLTLHLPGDQSPAKSVVEWGRVELPHSLVTVYDALPGEVALDVLLTAGATAAPCKASLALNGASPVTVVGLTGSPMRLAVTL